MREISFYGLLMSFLVIISIVSGCATIPPLKTSTGKPEVTISRVTQEEVFDKIAEEMLSTDYMLKSRTRNVVIFGMQLGKTKVWRTGGYANCENRVIFNIINAADGIRVMATLGQYSNPDTAYEYLEEDYSKQWEATQIQDILIAVKGKFEKDSTKSLSNISQNASRPIPPVQAAAAEETRIFVDAVGMVIKGNTVLSLIVDGPADKAGIKKGDLILTIDGVVGGTSQQNAARLNGKINTAVVLKIKRGDKESVVPLIRENPL